MVIIRRLTSLAFLAAWFAPTSAAEISSVLAQPIFGEIYACTENWQGNLKGLGDELGTDCFIERMVEANGRKWLRSYAGDGTKNEDTALGRPRQPRLRAPTPPNHRAPVDKPPLP